MYGNLQAMNQIMAQAAAEVRGEPMPLWEEDIALLEFPTINTSKVKGFTVYREISFAHTKIPRYFLQGEIRHEYLLQQAEDRPSLYIAVDETSSSVLLFTKDEECL